MNKAIRKLFKSFPLKKHHRRCNYYINEFGLTTGVRFYLTTLIRRNGLINLMVPNYKYPLILRANTSDIDIFRHIIVKHDYKIHANTNPKFIVDGGANIGLASIYFANKYPAAQIFAVEPDASNLSILKINTLGYNNITVFDGAIWHRKSLLEIENPADSKWAFRVRESESTEEAIKAITIDDILALSRENIIDILKLDIEGAEKEIFSATHNWLERVNVLIIELHDSIKEGCSDKFYRAIRNYDFKKFIKGENVILIRQYLV